MLRLHVRFSLVDAHFDDATQTSATANMTVVKPAHVIT
jgi:hypothetical protein